MKALAHRLLPAILFAGLASPANGDGAKCTVEMPHDLFSDFFAPIKPNLAFADGNVVGFRIYRKKSPPGALEGLGLRPDDLVTHFCGVRIHEVLGAEGPICCKTKPIPHRVELTIERDGKVISVIAPLPDQRV